MDTVFTSDSDMSIPYTHNMNNYNPIFIIVIIVIIFFVIWFLYKSNKKIENMSGGTIAQLFAQDSQDVYLKGNVDKLATSDFTLAFNQPTRQANVFQNRGQPMYSILLPDSSMNPTNDLVGVSNNYVDDIIDNGGKNDNLTFSNPVLKLDNVLPQTLKNNTNSPSDEINKIKKNKKNIKNKNNNINAVPTIPQYILPSSLPLPSNPDAPPNPYELSKIAKQVAVKKSTSDNLPPMTQWNPQDYLFQSYMDKALYDINCVKDPASCSGFAGGHRLSDGFVQSTKSVPSVNIDGNTFYTDSYVGSYFIEPNFDINKPYPVMLKQNE